MSRDVHPPGVVLFLTGVLIGVIHADFLVIVVVVAVVVVVGVGAVVAGLAATRSGHVDPSVDKDIISKVSAVITCRGVGVRMVAFRERHSYIRL